MSQSTSTPPQMGDDRHTSRRKSRPPLPADDPDHGTPRGYNRGCSCQPCKDANARAVAARRQAQREREAREAAAQPYKAGVAAVFKLIEKRAQVDAAIIGAEAKLLAKLGFDFATGQIAGEELSEVYFTLRYTGGDGFRQRWDAVIRLSSAAIEDRQRGGLGVADS